MKIIKGQFYAGVGSRETPPDILELMRRIGAQLAREGMILRSGGADGADLAFQAGAIEGKGEMEIFIPWNGFNHHSHGYNNAILVNNPAFLAQAEILAARYHPTYYSLRIGARKLMIRNVFQILGKNLAVPSSFLLCWTKDGADGTTIKTSPTTGGTGQAIRMAVEYGLTIRNLANPENVKKWIKWLEEKS